MNRRPPTPLAAKHAAAKRKLNCLLQQGLANCHVSQKKLLRSRLPTLTQMKGPAKRHAWSQKMMSQRQPLPKELLKSKAGTAWARTRTKLMTLLQAHRASLGPLQTVTNP